MSSKIAWPKEQVPGQPMLLKTNKQSPILKNKRSSLYVHRLKVWANACVVKDNGTGSLQLKMGLETELRWLILQHQGQAPFTHSALAWSHENIILVYPKVRENCAVTHLLVKKLKYYFVL